MNRTCSRCLESKQVSDFRVRKWGTRGKLKEGHFGICASCQNEKQRKYMTFEKRKNILKTFTIDTSNLINSLNVNKYSELDLQF